MFKTVQKLVANLENTVMTCIKVAVVQVWIIITSNVACTIFWAQFKTLSRILYAC